jgi:hypothetical protein
MFKPKVSHEVPLCLLEQSKQFNDYDYCLPHLLDQSEEYRNYFIQASQEDRYIIMDNSLHELGTPYSEDRLTYWLDKLVPDEFIVPDHWQDMERTLEDAERWSQKEFDHAGTTFVAVVQANDLREGLECFDTLKNSLGYKKIAISYGASWYNDLSTHPDPNYAKMHGRISFVRTLVDDFLLNEPWQDIKLHLLGCQLPQEFSYYHHLNCISTIDTSNPILAAIDNMKYENYGLNIKPKTKIDEAMDIHLYDLDLALVNSNVSLFRKINNI